MSKFLPIPTLIVYKNCEPGTPESDRFDVLATLISAYEQEHWPIEAPDAVTAIDEVMAMRGYARADLVNLLGSKSRASENNAGCQV